MSSSDFNEKVDKYHSDMNPTESDNIKSSYSKFLQKRKKSEK